MVFSAYLVQVQGVQVQLVREIFVRASPPLVLPHDDGVQVARGVDLAGIPPARHLLHVVLADLAIAHRLGLRALADCLRLGAGLHLVPAADQGSDAVGAVSPGALFFVEVEEEGGLVFRFYYERLGMPTFGLGDVGDRES